MLRRLSGFPGSKYRDARSGVFALKRHDGTIVGALRFDIRSGTATLHGQGSM
jgi:hypothetical protein